MTHLDWNSKPLTHSAIAQHEVTCPSVPAQIQGQLTDGRHFYFRYRSGVAALGLGDTAEAAVWDSMNGGYIRKGGQWDGVLTCQEADQLFAELYTERAAWP